MADDGRPLDPDDFDKTQVARDPALRALDAGATELLPRTPRRGTRRRTETVVTDRPLRAFEPAWWMALVAVLLVVAGIVAALALTDDDDDAVEPDVSATSIVVPTSQFVAPTTAPPPGATTTVAPPTDPPTTDPLPPGPTIVSFTGPASVTCTEPTDIELSWETTDATNATIAMERTIIATVAPSGSQVVEFPCDGEPHSYVLTAADDEGQATQRQISVAQA